MTKEQIDKEIDKRKEIQTEIKQLKKQIRLTKKAFKEDGTISKQEQAQLDKLDSSVFSINSALEKQKQKIKEAITKIKNKKGLVSQKEENLIAPPNMEKAMASLQSVFLPTPDLPTNIIDSEMKKKDGSYYKGYEAFSKTEEGRLFLEKFSNPKNNDTSIEQVKECTGGDMRQHTLCFRVDENEGSFLNGYTWVFLIHKNNLIDLIKVKKEHIQSNDLRFYFLIGIRENDANEEGMAQTIGHEIFAHAKRYSDRIESLLRKIKKEKLNPEEIVVLIHNIGKEDPIGTHDHILLKKGKKDDYEKYLDELQEQPKIDKELLQKKDFDDKSKY